MDTRDFMTILETVGIPAAFAVGAGWMVWKLFNHLIACLLYTSDAADE